MIIETFSFFNNTPKTYTYKFNLDNYIIKKAKHVLIKYIVNISSILDIGTYH